MNTQQPSSIYVRAIAVVAIIIIGGGALAYSILGKKADTAASTATVSAVSAQPTATASTATAPGTATTNTVVTTTTTSASTYKDGTYSAIGSYVSPGGDEKIGVTVTLKNDVITSSSVTPEPVSGEGRRYQQMFEQNYQQYVVGKKISDVHLTTVSGSSLTPAGFDQALATIEATAKA